MSDIYFKCTCGKSLAVDERGAGHTVNCADCMELIDIPMPEMEFPCKHCGDYMLAPKSMANKDVQCALCGGVIKVPMPHMLSLWGPQRKTPSKQAPSFPVPAVVKAAAALLLIGVGLKFAPWKNWMRDTKTEPLQSMNVPQTRSVMEVETDPVPPNPPETFEFTPDIESVETIHEFAGHVIKQPVPPIPMPDIRATVFQENENFTGPSTVPISGVDDFALKKAITAKSGWICSKWCRRPACLLEKQAESLFHIPNPPEFCGNRKKAETNPRFDVVGSFQKPAEATAPDATEYVNPEVKLLEEKAAALPPASEERYTLLREIHFKKQVPALRELHVESQKLNSLINYKTGPRQSMEFSKQLKKCKALLDEYTRTHTGKNLDGFFWHCAFFAVYGSAARTAESFGTAEKILRSGWALLDELQPTPVISRTKLRTGMETAQAWLENNPMETSVLLDELEGMALEAGMDKVGGIWRLNAPYMQIRFMEHAAKAPEEQRAKFIQRNKHRLEEYLLNDSIRARNRAFALRAWIVLLHEHGDLTDAQPVINTWSKRYGEENLPMNYYFARMWVESYGLGNWEKAYKTVLLATRAAQKGGKTFDHKRYANLIEVYYELQNYAGYELQRQRTVKQKQHKDTRIASHIGGK